MKQTDVNSAFEILLEEVEGVVNSLNDDGASAFQNGKYDDARQLIEDATRLTNFRKRVKDLQKEWQTLFASKSPKKARTTKKHKKLQRDLRTPDEEFRIPVLEGLDELGGSAPMSNVLDNVEQKMKEKLNRSDYERLASPPHDFRWRNTAQWCRNTLVTEGLMKSDSKREIWEISEEGRRLLESS